MELRSLLSIDFFQQPPSPLPPPPHPYSFLFLLRDGSLAINFWIFSAVPLIVFMFLACILITRKLSARHDDEGPVHVDDGDASILGTHGDAAAIHRSRSARVLAEFLKRVKIARMMEEPDGFVFDKEKAKNGDEGGENSSRDAATECAICLEELEDGDLCKALPQCSHVFHKECIVPWLVTNKNTCPLCRAAPVPVASVEHLPV